MRYFEFILEDINQIPWNKNPQIGWWLDNDPVTFYHGTHKKNIPFILENGIIAPEQGPTAGWVSLALDPLTARAYASMSGGESAFRAAGSKAFHVPISERIVIVLKIPQDYFLKRMASARGLMKEQKNKLSNKNLYLEFKEKYPNSPDAKYYELTEIRLPKHIPSKFIIGYMRSK